MTRLRESKLAVILIMLLFGAAAKPEAAPAEPAADIKTVIEQAKRAVGTAAALARIRSIQAEYHCTGPKGYYSTRLTSYGSSNVLLEQTFSYRDTPSRLILSGEYGWNLESSTRPPELLPAVDTMVVRLHNFQRMVFDFESMFSQLELDGEGDFRGAAAYIVRAKSELDWPVTLYFNKKDKHLAGYMIQPKENGEAVVNRFEDWRTVEGINLPFKITATDSAGDWVLKLTSITFNSVRQKIFMPPRSVADMTELLRLHKQAETAHLTYNAELFVSMFGENLTQIQSGEVVTRDKKTNLARFKEYFRTFKFDAWENIVPPVIKISKDGTLATVQVQKRVTGDYTDEAGKVHSSETIFAWLEVWEKIDGKWKVVTVASTRKQ